MLCVGHTQYFVKASPRSDNARCQHVAQEYGLPFTEPLRFAMCKVWRVQEKGYRVSETFKKSGPYQAMARSLVDSKQCANNAAVGDLMDSVARAATIYRRVTGTSRVRLDGIDVIARPLDAALQKSPWALQPMVCINPTFATGGLDAHTQPRTGSAPRAVQDFEKAVRRTKNTVYFTHPYGMSTLG